jgi:hypothetical protein
MTARAFAPMPPVRTPPIGPHRAVLQRKCACGGSHSGSGECDDCERKRLLQRKHANGSTPDSVPPIVYDVLRSPGEALDASTRTFFEPRLGHDFSRVRVHTDAQAAESAAAVNAMAYTVGRDVVMGGGQYSPATAQGRQLLAHELVHVIQQDASDNGAAPGQQLRGLSQPGDSDELEAESIAQRTTSVTSAAGGAAEALASVPRGSVGRLQRRVRSFQCTAAEHRSVEGFLGVSIPPGDLRAAADAASQLLSAWMGQAAGELRVSPRSAATSALFHEAFGADPGWVPRWRPAGATWVDFGDLIARRLTNAATIVDAGSIQYFCWGSPAHCPECTFPHPAYFACSSFLGAYRICLGENFWVAWQAGDVTTMGSTLLHEALHIYYGQTVSDAGRSGNANCYERFVVSMNGVFMHPATAANCPPAAP